MSLDDSICLYLQKYLLSVANINIPCKKKWKVEIEKRKSKLPIKYIITWKDKNCSNPPSVTHLIPNHKAIQTGGVGSLTK